MSKKKEPKPPPESPKQEQQTQPQAPPLTFADAIKLMARPKMKNKKKPPV